MSAPPASAMHLAALLEKLHVSAEPALAKAAGELHRALASLAVHQGGSQIPPDRVSVLYDHAWNNYQGNLHQSAVERQYVVGNRPSMEWTDGLRNVQLVIEESARDGRSLRASGSTWSSSPVCQTPTYLINCAGLSLPGPEIEAAMLAPGVDPARIAHVQGGMVIQRLNEYLESRGQSLHVMGSNGGQNIAGAASTGTHGSWIDRRAVADSVHAVALVGAGGKAYWIEPASRPLTQSGFQAWGAFEIVRDDALFAAAQVSVGAIGVVTSLVLDVDPLYWIEFSRTPREFDAAIQRAIYQLDLSGLGFGDRRPAHFQVVLNPYGLDAGQQGVRMEAGFVVPPQPAAAQSGGTPARATTGDAASNLLWDALAALLSAIPELVPTALELVLPFAFPTVAPYSGPLSQVWHVSTGGPPLISTELAVPQERVEATLDLLRARIEAARPHFYWPGVFGIRFGEKTNALLGFTRFDRWCTMELVYLRGVAGVAEFLRGFYDALKAAGIPHALHWGQVNFQTAADVAESFGADTLARWKAAREALGAAGSTFANDQTNTWGLTTP